MKTILTFLLSAWVLIAPAQVVLLISLDSTIEVTRPYQFGVELQTALSEPSPNKNISYGTSIPSMKLVSDSTQTWISKFGELKVENSSIESSLVELKSTSIALVITSDQFAKASELRISTDSFDTWQKEQRIGEPSIVLSHVTYRAPSYYWNDKKVAAILLVQ